jgi:Domain of unknown function (DUF5679)
MRRGIAAVGAVIAAGLVIERIRELHGHAASAPHVLPAMPEPTAYCLHCKASRRMDDPHSVVMKNGRPGTKGHCPVCGRGLASVASVAA